MRRRTTAVALLVLALLAVGGTVLLAPGVVPLGSDGTDSADGSGDTGASLDSTADPPASPYDPDVTVRGGELGTDTDAIFGWTLAATNRTPSEVSAPTVWIGETRNVTHPLADRPFQRLLILEDPDGELPDRPVTALADADDVRLNEERLSALRNGEDGPTLEHVLVHEFTHVVQRQSSFMELPERQAVQDDEPPRSSHDLSFAWLSVAEGGAEFVADDYTDGGVLEHWERRWATLEPHERLVRWPYYRGAQWADARLDGPEALLELDRTPERTATVLRREAPDEQPPTVSLSADLPNAWVVDRDRLGAVTVDVALSSQLSVQRSRDVAAGLRVDEYRRFERDAGDRPGHVWLTNYQNRSAADEFEAAMAAYLDARGNRTGERWTGVGNASFAIERTDPTTVTVVAGAEQFVDRVTVVGEDDEYTVEEDSAGEVGSDAKSPSASADAISQPRASAGS